MTTSEDPLSDVFQLISAMFSLAEPLSSDLSLLLLNVEESKEKRGEVERSSNLRFANSRAEKYHVMRLISNPRILISDNAL